jgi:CheY-specific phosphatase CheX
MTQTIEADRANALLGLYTTSVFADMAFMDVQKDTGGTTRKKDAEEILCASIDVLQPLSCRIELLITKTLLDRIVSNLFGEELPSPRQQEAGDSLLEMLNIIAGNFLSGYFSTGTEIQLELPRYLYLGEQEQGEAVTCLDMNAEGEPLTVRLCSVRYRY